MGFLDVTIVNVAFPDIERDFAGASQADLSWVLNAYNIVFAALLVPAGRVADLVGRRRMFLIGVTAFVAASVLCGVASSPEGLVAARVLQAAAGAILVPTSLALLLPEFPPERRATAVAIWSATGAVAAALGPSLGGVLVDQLGWRWVFFANVPIGLAALVPARRILRETRDPGGVLPDALGSALIVAGVGALALGIVKGSDWGWDSGRVLGAPPRSCHRAEPVPRAFVRGRERRHVRLLDGVLRAPALQRAVPHAGVGLLDPHGRLRRHARAADGGPHGAGGGATVGPLRPAGSRAARGALLHGGL